MSADFPIDMLALPEPARTEAWRRWRAEADIERLSYEEMQGLPLLAGALPDWLEKDPAGARLLGIVKMAWGRNQTRLQRAVQARRTLLQSGVSPVAFIGPLAWSVMAREAGAIRAIPDLTLLIPRRYLFQAVQALQAGDWKLCSPEPEEKTLTWSSHVAFTSKEDTLHLHWRICGPGQSKTVAGFEGECLRGLRTAVWNGHPFTALSAEVDLLHRLLDRPAWDPVSWQADVLMMPFAGVRLGRLQGLARRFQEFFDPCDVLGRLAGLRRAYQLPIPDPERRELRSRFFAWRSLIWRA